MPGGTLQILGLGTSPAPLSYDITGSQLLDLIAVKADFDGSAVLTSFVPVVEIISNAGHVMATAKGPTVAAGASATVTFATFLGSTGATGVGIDYNKVNDHDAAGNPALYLDIEMPGNGGIAIANAGTGGLTLQDSGLLGGLNITTVAAQTGGLNIKNNGKDGVGLVDNYTLAGGGGVEIHSTHNAINIETIAAGDITISADNGQIIMGGLPVADPGVSGALWNNAGVVNISP